MQLSKQVEFSESEDGITSDILRIAGKISRKIERKQRKHRSRKTNETDDVTTQDSIELTSFQYCDSGMPSNKKRKLKQENKTSDMSPSEKEETFSQTQKEKLESVTSPKKRKKHKLPEKDKSESVTDNGVSGSNASQVFSPKKRKQTESDNQDNSVSSKKKKKRDDTCNSRDNVDDCDKDSSSVSSGVRGTDESDDEPKQKRAEAQLHNFRFQRKGFQQVDVSSSIDQVLSGSVVKNQDLWLIKAPCDFDMTSLNKKTVSLSDRVTDLDLPEQKCDVVVSRQPSELCPLISNQSTRCLQQGGSFVGQLQIISSIDVPPVPPIQVPPRNEHTIPESLRQRYVPFGADNPVKSSQSRQKKKHKKDHKKSTQKKKKKS